MLELVLATILSKAICLQDSKNDHTLIKNKLNLIKPAANTVYNLLLVLAYLRKSLRIFY